MDREALATLGIFHKLPMPQSYQGEIDLIRDIQRNLLQSVVVDNSAPTTAQPVEPGKLLLRGRGACYELSRALEKALAINGLESRRVFFLYRQGKSFQVALVTRGHPSHAAVEVKTSRGWLLVDSIYPWLSTDTAGNPVPANDIWRHTDRFAEVPEHLSLSSWAIRGMYSRNGQLYGSPLPGPEMNWHDFATWLLSTNEDRHLH